MRDFNSDNKKVDTVLKELASKSAWTLLASSKTNATAATLSLNVPTAKVIQQQLVLIRVFAFQVEARLTINGSGSRYAAGGLSNWEGMGILEVSNHAPGWALIPIGKRSDGRIRGVSSGIYLYYLSSDITPAEWTTLELNAVSSTIPLPANSTIELWGCY